MGPVAGRAVGLLVMAVLGWQILRRELDFDAASGALRFIHGIDLVIHEAGHTFAFILPRFFYILGGSALQVILPAVCALTFLHPAAHRLLRGRALLDGRERHGCRHLHGGREEAGAAAAGRRRDRATTGTISWGNSITQLGPWLGRLTFGMGILIITVALAIVANETYRAWQRAARRLTAYPDYTATTAT